MSTSLILWKVSATAYNAISIREEISNLWESIRNIYSDISEAHVNSALQAIAAAEHSKFNEHEILDAISHLRDAYNVCESVLNKTKKEFFFGDMNLIYDDEDRSKYRMYLAHLAGVISILYKSLNEHQSADEWKNMAIKKFKSGFYISLSTLKYINNDYVVEETNISENHLTGEVFVITSCVGTSSEGEEYLQAQKLAQIKEFGESIDQRTLELKSLVKP